MIYETFAPARFELDPQAADMEYALNPHVAARITNTLIACDSELRSGNSRGDVPVVVDPAGRLGTHAVPTDKEPDLNGDTGYRISFAANSVSPVNEQFASEMQAALFQGSRRNHLGAPGVVGLSGIFMGLPAAVATAGATIPDLPWEFRGFMMGIGVWGAWNFKSIPVSLYRLHVMNPESRAHARRLRAAAEIARSLELPPVVTVPAGKK